ncbi:MAG: GNAT family N-acetyltransferase [Anaerolineales bacterium]|nr:MAG: GNAT family N-acetyltransferase [Anaerolineales bacterium]
MNISLPKAASLFLSKFPGLLKVSRLCRPSSPRYTIRAVDADRDLEALAALGTALSGGRPEALRESFRLEFTEQDPRRWFFLVAVKEGRQEQVLGFVRAMRQGPEQDWWIAGLGVKPLYRRWGIGEALTRAALARLQEAGAVEVRLGVNRASRPAVTLYRKLGFVEESQPTGQAEGDGSVRMIKNL